MDTSQDDFSPMSIDPQIDPPDELLSREDAQLIHEIRAMFEQKKHTSIEQGWARIVSQRTSSDQQSELLSTYQQRNEKISTMHDHTLPSTSTQATPKKRSVLRLLSLVAAALVCVVLVGSLTLVLGASRGKTPGPKVGSSNTTQKATPTPTATPLIIPAACKDPANLTDQKLCAKGEEKTLNITRNFTVHTHDQYGKVSGSTTLNITFLRAYADTSQLLLVYRLNKAPAQALGNDWGGFQMLITNQGYLSASSGCMWKGLCAQSFPVSNLPAGIKQIKTQALQTAFDELLPLAFTLPFNTTPRQTVTVNHAVTQNGYTLTLDHLVLANSTTTLFYTYTEQAAKGRVACKVQAITINGQKQVIDPGDFGIENVNQTSVSGTIVLNQAFLDQPGTWAVTLALTNFDPHAGFITLMTGTFTFTVSA